MNRIQEVALGLMVVGTGALIVTVGNPISPGVLAQPGDTVYYPFRVTSPTTFGGPGADLAVAASKLLSNEQQNHAVLEMLVTKAGSYLVGQLKSVTVPGGPSFNIQGGDLQDVIVNTSAIQSVWRNGKKMAG